MFLNVEDLRVWMDWDKDREASNVPRQVTYNNRTMIESKSPEDFEISNESYPRRT